MWINKAPAYQKNLQLLSLPYCINGTTSCKNASQSLKKPFELLSLGQLAVVQHTAIHSKLHEITPIDIKQFLKLPSSTSNEHPVAAPWHLCFLCTLPRQLVSLLPSHPSKLESTNTEQSNYKKLEQQNRVIQIEHNTILIETSELNSAKTEMALDSSSDLSTGTKSS